MVISFFYSCSYLESTVTVFALYVHLCLFVCFCLFVCLFVDAEQEGGMKFYGKCAFFI